MTNLIVIKTAPPDKFAVELDLFGLYFMTLAKFKKLVKLAIEAGVNEEALTTLAHWVAYDLNEVKLELSRERTNALKRKQDRIEKFLNILRKEGVCNESEEN